MILRVRGGLFRVAADWATCWTKLGGDRSPVVAPPPLQLLLVRARAICCGPAATAPVSASAGHCSTAVIVIFSCYSAFPYCYTSFQSYVGDNAATAATLTPDGWLKTGDLCYFDSDGFLYIVDRLKELIKYKAYQVPPAELEHIIHSIPGVADVAVIPYPDEDAGEIPMAYVVRSPGSNISEDQIKDFVAKQVSPYKKVRRVVFINTIPKSPTGKVLRRELVKHALSGASARL